jgi:hypothetical protein
VHYSPEVLGFLGVHSPLALGLGNAVKLNLRLVVVTVTDCHGSAEVEALATGRLTVEQLNEIGDDPAFAESPERQFARWIRAFSYMRLNERPIEGWHSRATRHVRRSPNISVAALSFELRYEYLCRLLVQQPQARQGRQHH